MWAILKIQTGGRNHGTNCRRQILSRDNYCNEGCYLHFKITHRRPPGRILGRAWQGISLITKNVPILMDGHKILMPKGLQIESMVKLHMDTHGSANSMKETVQPYCTQKNRREDIETVVSNCEICQQLQVSKPEGKPRTDKLPLTDLQPMSVSHIDLFNYKNTDYLSIHDQVLTFTWFAKLDRIDIGKVLRELDTLQLMFGNIMKVVSDNGRQLVSAQFEAYCKLKNTVHKTSSPYSLTSNIYTEPSIKRWLELTGQSAH